MTCYKRIFFLALSICFSINILFAQEKDNHSFSLADSIYLNFVDIAEKAIATEDWNAAENALLNAMRGQPSNPANVLLLSNLSIVRYQQGNDSLALATINDAVVMAPKSATVLNNRARILKNMGRIDEAYLDYGTILDLDSTLIEPRYMHGIIALSKNDLNVAFNDFSKLESIAPNDEYTIDGLAMYYFHTNNLDKAIPYFSKLISNNPSIENYTSIILCYLFSDKLSEASTSISDAMRLYPLEGQFYLHRAYLNHLYYRHNDCDNDIKRAIELGVSSKEANSWREAILNSYK